jgi:hypothetical protein
VVVSVRKTRVMCVCARARVRNICISTKRVFLEKKQVDEILDRFRDVKSIAG